MVQQRQPDCSTTVVSSSRSSRWWSRAISPNSLISTAVSENPGSRSNRCKSVVLPEPRKPVIRVTGVNSGIASAKLGLQPGNQILFERIARSANEPLCSCPEMRKVVDHLGLPSCGPQHERAALPVDERHPIVL